ncbi:MAG: hypothetical protein N2037_08670 [Acidimicrobiales bacterium]|nr:hypothetical protein [Acidimicrobiales bacterium]
MSGSTGDVLELLLVGGPMGEGDGSGVGAGEAVGAGAEATGWPTWVPAMKAATTATTATTAAPTIQPVRRLGPAATEEPSGGGNGGWLNPPGVIGGWDGGSLGQPGAGN